MAAPLRPPARETYLDRTRERAVTFVELDPPYGLSFDRLLAGCRLLHSMGVDAVTMGDSPLATLRVSNLATAALVQGRVGIECMVHVTCRDTTSSVCRRT
jgi:homocysteine S-methyltransferase